MILMPKITLSVFGVLLTNKCQGKYIHNNIFVFGISKKRKKQIHVTKRMLHTRLHCSSVHNKRKTRNITDSPTFGAFINQILTAVVGRKCWHKRPETIFYKIRFELLLEKCEMSEPRKKTPP